MSSKESYTKEDIITLDFADGDSADCFVIGTFDYNEHEYMALAPNDGTDEVYIYQYEQTDDESFKLHEIESLDDWNRVAEEFDKLIEDKQ